MHKQKSEAKIYNWVQSLLTFIATSSVKMASMELERDEAQNREDKVKQLIEMTAIKGPEEIVTTEVSNTIQIDAERNAPVNNQKKENEEPEELVTGTVDISNSIQIDVETNLQTYEKEVSLETQREVHITDQRKEKNEPEELVELEERNSRAYEREAPSEIPKEAHVTDQRKRQILMTFFKYFYAPIAFLLLLSALSAIVTR